MDDNLPEKLSCCIIFLNLGAKIVFLIKLYVFLPLFLILIIMYKIALTGGIGTGKTYLSKHFIQMGIPVFYADDEAKKLYQNPDFIQKMKEQFGEEIFSNGVIDLRKLSQKVFGNAEELQKLNQLVHPAVMQLFNQWAEQQGAETVMMESAIVFEGGLTDYFDKIIVADAPLELRIRRISARNPEWSEEEIQQRIAKQMPQSEKCRRADLVVCTGETYKEANL